MKTVRSTEELIVEMQARIEALEAALRWIADMPWTADRSMTAMQLGAINQRIHDALAPEQDK